ncbi:hypothetical protein GC088_03785 [Arthrobacter sp. JZ12]|uniref:hypothetical protein n=1 Tax=Arthrobacter sp. JZ12 TaxID=2654190 RepID=UPI002B48CA86|nr:hypothetical protein [Arthrobacter sp. JZ12]WRH24298.1 hypothetical protein GC088_03785 [Arthrobacter sp. JZ12]
MQLSHIPLRLSTGAFILNSGIGKQDLDRDTAAYLQGMAANAFPQVKQLDPEKFGKVLAGAETALGAALLLPFIPSHLVGLGLAAFSGGLLAMYFRTPGMTQDDAIRPSQEGTPVAKDVWMLGIALALILDGGKKR